MDLAGVKGVRGCVRAHCLPMISWCVSSILFSCKRQEQPYKHVEGKMKALDYDISEFSFPEHHKTLQSIFFSVTFSPVTNTSILKNSSSVFLELRADVLCCEGVEAWHRIGLATGHGGWFFFFPVS